jgi:hypothetical protein
MKKIIFLLIIVGLIILVASCQTPKVSVSEDKPALTAPVENFEKWNPEVSKKLENLGVDPAQISFFNSTDVSLNQMLLKEIVEVVDGEVLMTDSTFQIEKLIKKMTPGKIIEKTQLGLPLIISFSENDQSYLMKFVFLKEENAFVLSGEGTFEFRGVSYKVKPQTNERCYLLFSLKKEKVVTNIKEEAEGINRSKELY